MRPKFGNSNISLGKAISFKDLTKNADAFEGGFWFKFNNLESVLGQWLHEISFRVRNETFSIRSLVNLL